MKIALVAPTYLPARRANTFQVMKMAQAIAVTGHEVHVLAPDRPRGEKEVARAWDEIARHYGLHHPFPISWLPASPSLRGYDYALRAVRWARRWGADVLYTRLPQAAALGSLLGMATILEVHDLPMGRIGPWMFRRFLRGRGAHRLVVISRALATDLVARFGAPAGPPFTLIAADGVDLARYVDLPTPEAARQLLWTKVRRDTISPQVRAFTAGYTGHLYAGRGVELMLALAASLPEVVFLLVGGDPQDVARWQAEVNRRQLGNVILTGFVPNADLPLYQAACDVLLMPYQRQVAASSGGDIAPYLSPMKMFEYLACGRAILSSDLPVLREVLTPQNALLLPPEDVDAWIAALQMLREDPASRAALAAQARRDAHQYTWESRATRILGEA